MDRTTVINAALTLTGNRTVKINDNSPEWVIGDLHYLTCVNAALERTPWSFARKTAFLDGLIEGDFEWSTGAKLPDDNIKVRNLYLLPVGLTNKECAFEYRHDDFEEIAGSLYWGRKGDWCRRRRALIEYTYEAPECDWSPNFRKGVIYRLAAVFARSINEESAEAQALDFKADLAFGFAAVKSTDRKNRVDPDQRKMGRIMRRRIRGSR